MKSRLKDITVYISLALASLIIILPVLFYCMLSIPYADDFSNARSSMEYFNIYGSHFIGALHKVWDIWLTFQATYTGEFILSYFNAFARFGLTGMRVFNTVCILLLFASLLWLSYSFCKEGKKPWRLTLSVYLIVLFWITNNYINSEVYTWNTVICVYIIPITFILLGEAFYLEYVRTESKLWIGALICGLFIGGGAINVATLGCGLYLITAVYGLYQKGIKERFLTCVPLTFTIICTLFNTMAPGNFIRWGDDHEISVFKIFAVSTFNIIKRLLYLSVRTPFVAILLVLFIVIYGYGSFDYEKKLKYEHPILVGLMYVLAGGVVNFPFCLGYNVDSFVADLEDRSLFVQDLTVYIFVVVWMFYLAGYVRRKYQNFEINSVHIMFATLFCLTSVLLIFGYGGYEKMGTPYMICGIADGSAKDYADYQEQIMQQVCYGDNVETIYYDAATHARKNEIILGLRLSDDPDRWDWWHNAAIAAYYGKSVPMVVYND